MLVFIRKIQSRFRGDQNVYRKYGEIKTSLLYYITPTMITLCLICVGLIILNFDMLRINFDTNIPLNSLIFFVFTVAILQATENNVNIYNTACFFARFESLVRGKVITEEDIKELKKRLETKAFFVNTKNTFRLVDNLEKYGHPLISDSDARIIKSKLGMRIRISRSRVSFMGGILVMLGLIGTFWGLLLTIGAVGDAMTNISSQASSLGEGGDMGGIIKSISAPLGGMGLAFSSSLFGLSGSLVVGFFNHSCTQAQDAAIEDFSRWIDDYIPRPEKNNVDEGKATAKLDKEMEAGKGEGDLEAWLASFVVLSRKNERVNAEILEALARTAEAHIRLAEGMDRIHTAQQTVAQAVASGRDDVALIRTHQGEIDKTGKDILQAVCRQEEVRGTILHNMEEGLKVDTAIQARLTEDSTILQTYLNNNNRILESGVKEIHENFRTAQASVSNTGRTLEDIKEDLRRTHGQNQGHADALLKAIMDVREKIPAKEYDNIRQACSAIVGKIDAMNDNLDRNVEVMERLAKEGNMQKMSRILKEMQIFWLQMKESRSHSTGTDE